MNKLSTLSKLSSTALPGIAARHRAERRFRNYGLAAILFSLLFLAFVLVSIFISGKGAFVRSQILLEINFDPAELGIAGPEADLSQADFLGVLRSAVRQEFPDISGRRDRRELYGLLSAGAEYELRDYLSDRRDLIGKTESVWVDMSDDADMYRKGEITPETGEGSSPISAQQAGWIDSLEAQGRIRTSFNWIFLTNSDSRDPEYAGVWGAIVGSFLALTVCLALSFSIGSLSAIYLEEFAPKNRWTNFIEVNINNLAAVPSIIFGLLGLAIFLNLFGLPRSAALVGGMVLALMTMPTVIIAGRASLKSVPPSIREAALGLGASPIQTVFHHVVPLAMPGILTGTIIGMARALGETAPLLMIGMIAFIVDPPHGFTDPATALPVQVYLWADSPERAFAEKTSGAILVLLAFLVLMNLTAVILRKRYEKKW